MTKRRELPRTLVHCINSSLVATMEYFSRDFNRFLATRIVYEYSIPFRLSRLRDESPLVRRVSSWETSVSSRETSVSSRETSVSSQEMSVSSPREKRDATGNLHLTSTVGLKVSCVDLIFCKIL